MGGHFVLKWSLTKPSDEEDAMSNQNGYPAKDWQPDVVTVSGTIVGTGADTPTVVEGRGFTVSYLSATGKYRITLSNTYLALVSSQYSIGAATIGDVKGFTIHDLKVLASNQTVDFWLYDASQTLADLAALQYISFTLRLRDTTVQQ